jgi:hypothetical protein
MFCSQSTFMRFVRISEQTAISYLHSSNETVFTAVKEGVYCAVRTIHLNTRLVKFLFASMLARHQHAFGRSCDWPS